MIPTSSVLRNTTTALRPALRRPVVGAGAALTPRAAVATPGLGIAGRRWNTEEQRGGRSKLIFRFGPKDIPVELYPMAFVVLAACVGAGVAIGKQFYSGDLRTGPNKPVFSK
ncbi:hypothetical protein IAT38_004835 [Cryptococcus sp. DSM 104549]